MTYPTQHLNVFGVCPQSRFCAVRFYVVTLKMLCCATFFAFPSFFNNIANYLSNRVRSLASTPLPFMVISPTHFFTSCFSHARYRAIFMCTTTTFAYLKRCFALFTHALYKCFLFAWFYFLRTYFRASVGTSSHMGVRPGKLNTAGGANKFNMPPTLNFSLEFGHG